MTIPSPPLPDGRTVSVAWELCRGASWMEYQLANGRIVTAVIARESR